MWLVGTQCVGEVGPNSTMGVLLLSGTTKRASLSGRHIDSQRTLEDLSRTGEPRRNPWTSSDSLPEAFERSNGPRRR